VKTGQSPSTRAERGHPRWAVIVGLTAALGLSACAGGEGNEEARAVAPTSTASPSAGAPDPSPEVTSGQAGDPSSEPSPVPPSAEPSEDSDQTAGATPGPSSQESVLESLPGDTSGACVDADGKRDVRSGGIAAGAFDEASASYDAQGDVVSLYWIPEHADDLSGLTVRGTQLSGGNGSFVHDETKVSDLVGDSGVWHYYLTAITVPAPGAWRLEATSGPDSGCFTVTFGG